MKKKIDQRKVIDKLERFANAHAAEGDDEEIMSEKTDEHEDFDDQHKILPTSKDPKLWLVKCKRGMEKQACMSLMNKCVDSAKRKIP